MRLSLKGIGKIDSASVEINGITVIAGENNTGKSTVGRALFAVFNSFYNIQKQIEYERIDSVENLLERLYFEGSSRSFNKMLRTSEIAKSIVSHMDVYRTDSTSLKRGIIGILEQYGVDIAKGYDTSIVVDQIVERIKDVLAVSNAEFLKSLLEKKLDAEFKGQICNIFQDMHGQIQLEIKGQSLSVLIESDEVRSVTNPERMTLHTEVVYIDDPFVLDELGNGLYRIRSQYADHRVHLLSKLYANQQAGNLVDEIITKEKLESIYEKISTVCSGDIVREKRTQVGYRRQNSEKVLDVRNLSTGLKTFVMLKMLLMNGTIERNGTIILDEPEIHLHPEWQLLFAELIVLMQKEFGLHVLLNTHSPYFLRAIQVYSAKYSIADTCKYYLSEVDGDQAHIVDVSDCVDKIYEKLSRPLQKLEDERWKND